jgi:uncharacterized metal-binding protein
MSDTEHGFSCSDCPTLNCGRQNSVYPEDCLTEAVGQEQLDEIIRAYTEDPETSSIASAAAEIVASGYGKLNRVEEIAAFAKKLGAKKAGIATCIGLVKETRIFVDYLKSQGLESYSVLCKVGAIDKLEIGLPKKKEGHESICNPVLQARLLAEQKTDLNVIIGLCVGHDSLFIKYSKAPVTYLIVKDRVFGHNIPAALAKVSEGLQATK